MALGKIKADTLEHSTAGSLDTQYVVNGSAKSWMNFNGTGTVAARDSFNATLTDNGNGDYTLNFINAMSNANYAVVGATSGNSANGNPFTFELPPHYNDGVDAQVAGSVRVYSVLTGANSKQDVTKVHVTVHGDLA